MKVLCLSFIQAQIEKTILFKVTQPDSDYTSYLFGTHHAFGSAFFDSIPVANEALSTCHLMIKENLNLVGNTAEAIINLRTEFTPWASYLNKQDLAFISDLFRNSPTDFNKMTPAEMFAFLSRYRNQQNCLTQNVGQSSLTLDDYIGKKAEQLGLVLIGLETTEEQIKLINQDIEGMPRKIHRKRLSTMIEHIRSQNEESCEEIEWYRQMEIDYRLEDDCTNTLVLTDRNKKWMQTIIEKIDSNNCFIAVGLSHLMYECGLISQLRIHNYIITPIDIK